MKIQRYTLPLIALAFIIVASGCARTPITARNMPVTVAVVDTGFDLDHPLLSRLKVIDAYDFSEDDRDVSPYIRRRGDELKGSAFERVQSLLKLEPGLSRWFPLKRNVEREFQAAAFHGTAVASLVTYDYEPNTALYKIFPIPATADPDEWMTEAVIGAIERAAKNNARIINLSLGFTFESNSAQVQKHRKLMSTFTDVIRRHPEILFVSASGNENQVIDNTMLYGYPCGLAAPNVLCVGALNSKKEIWNPSTSKGTNIVQVEGSEMIFAPGENVYSAVPVNMGVSKLARKALFSKDPIEPDLAKELLSACSQNPGFAPGEATSIATPLVSHRALEILSSNPEITVAVLKERLIKSSLPLKTKLGLVRYIEPSSPSWSLNR